MGQTLSLSNPPSVRVTSPTTHRQPLKRVHSEEIGEGKKSISLSLPSSPSIRRRADSTDPQHEQLESPTKTSLTFESMIKNFEEFAQHQWPTWAKRRGWVTDPDQTSEAPASLMTTSDDGSGRVVQVDKDKWVFLRHRKKCTPSLSPVGISSIPVETVVEEDALSESTIDNMVDILHIDESRLPTGVSGQRSRRSSGYASASSSPSTTKKASESLPTATTVNQGVEDANEDWRISSLYEVTLRWMFEADAFEREQPYEEPTSQKFSLNDSGTSSDRDSVLITERPHDAAESSSEIIRIYLHFFCRLKNKLPSFIDFRPISTKPVMDNQNVICERPLYALVFQDESPALEILFPRDIPCVDLIRQIVTSHPQLGDWEPKKLAIYEKSWQPGKTSRARLRRLNDFDCPLLLAHHWQVDRSNLCSSYSAKTLILQESQNGDIPWEEFTIAELSSFLKVLDREEKNHEMQIRERYYLLNKRLQETMQSHPSTLEL